MGYSQTSLYLSLTGILDLILFKLFFPEFSVLINLRRTLPSPDFIQGLELMSPLIIDEWCLKNRAYGMKNKYF